MKILFMNGAEIVMVSKLMGHRSQKTTRQYIIANGWHKKQCSWIVDFYVVNWCLI